jgi:hypothetical protein
MTHNSVPTRESGGVFNQEKMEYQKKIEAQLRRLDVRIKELEARTARAAAEVLIESKEQLRKLRAKREEMADQLERLRNVSEDAWVDLKLGIDTALGELKAALAAAVSRFS